MNERSQEEALQQVWSRNLAVGVRRIQGSLFLDGPRGPIHLPPEATWLWTALDGTRSLREVTDMCAVELDRCMATELFDDLVKAQVVCLERQASTPVAAVGALPEKQFISSILGSFASTAQTETFEDCIVIDVAGAALVLNIDHPGRIRGAPETDEEYQFYGRWVAAAVCSDVISMGVQPVGFAVDLRVESATSINAVESIYRGLQSQLGSYGAELTGGNVDSGPLDLVGCAWGLGDRDQLVRRGGAAPGDLIVATCSLGRGWARELLSDAGLWAQLDVPMRAEAEEYAVRFRTPMEPILECAQRGLLSSGMDLSDGILEFCFTVADRNGAGVEITAAELGGHPIVQQAGELMCVDPAFIALDPGYDFPYSHGYTVQADRFHEVATIFSDHDQPLTLVGRVESATGVRIKDREGRLAQVPRFHDDQTYTSVTRIGSWKTMAESIAAEWATWKRG